MGADDEPNLPPIPRDDASEDPNVSPSTIVARIVDEKDAPVPNVVVTLGIVRNSVTEGDSKTRVTAVTDANGFVTFADLKKGSGWAYRVSVVATAAEDPRFMATYAAEPFQLPLDHGYRVLLHRFPVSTSIDKLFAAVEGVDTIVEVRDDVIEVEQVFDVINASTTTWALGPGLTLPLPKSFKALRTAEAMSDQHVTAVEGVGAKWTGSFPPGRSRIAYDFKIPFDGDPQVEIDLGLPPRVLAARVRIAARRGMGMSVDGFPPAQSEALTNGVKVLSTVRQGTPEEPISALRIRVGGLPTVGPERWLAVMAAIFAAAAGLYFSLRAPESSDRKAMATARKRRRRELLAELVELERAHRSGEVGPKAYARERAKLLDRVADTLEPEAAPQGAR